MALRFRYFELTVLLGNFTILISRFYNISFHVFAIPIFWFHNFRLTVFWFHVVLQFTLFEFTVSICRFYDVIFIIFIFTVLQFWFFISRFSFFIFRFQFLLFHKFNFMVQIIQTNSFNLLVSNFYKSNSHSFVALFFFFFFFYLVVWVLTVFRLRIFQFHATGFVV